MIPRASWPTVSLALVAVLLGLLGNVLLDPESVGVFGEYFALVAGGVILMFMRVQLLKWALFILRAVVERIEQVSELFRKSLLFYIDRINSMTVVYLTRDR